MPRGKKSCPKCDLLCAASTKLCSCGHVFQKAPSKKKPSFFKERKDFIKRMLDGGQSSDYKLDIMTATKVFKAFGNDIDFLSKVKPPFKLDGSIKYFLSKDGRDYLLKKHREFHYRPKNVQKMVDQEEKSGEDVVVNKKKTLRNFLDE